MKERTSRPHSVAKAIWTVRNHNLVSPDAATDMAVQAKSRLQPSCLIRSNVLALLVQIISTYMIDDSSPAD